MSMSKYMHPRNIYKTPPNFKQLAIEYPEFRKHVKQELSGKVSLDFKDISALRALSCTLLKKDFDLNVEIPLNKLIPTIPLRLNYILWIEDLLQISGNGKHVKGIDIGTGASCVYPLISAKKYNWSMLGTDVDDESITFARENIERNNLQELIKVLKIESNCILKEAVDENHYDFCMCNPPFFASQQETVFTFKSRKESRPHPKNAFCATSNEVVVKGGEVEFIGKMIEESKDLQQKIKIYTTMIGHKVSLAPLKKLLRETEIISFKQTEFCQGNTTRWGLAWTYCDIDLRKLPEATIQASRKQKSNKNLVQYIIPETSTSTADEIAEKITKLFKDLKIEFTEVKHGKNVIAFNITAHSNTWSHQRRKRRGEKRISDSQSIDAISCNNNKDCEMKVDSGCSSPNDDRMANLICDLQVKSPGKRKLEDDEGYYNNKKVRIVDEEEAVNISKVFLESTTVIRKESDGIHLELIWIDGIASKDNLHQILQYFKNNLKN